MLETVWHGKDENPHLFKGYLVLDRDRGFLLRSCDAEDEK